MNTSIESMKNIDINAVDINTLVDINNIKINNELPKTERIIDLINQIKNPYCYKCGKIIVKVGFAETENTIEDELENYFLTI